MTGEKIYVNLGSAVRADLVPESLDFLRSNKFLCIDVKIFVTIS
jgi:hypothetical protein